MNLYLRLLWTFLRSRRLASMPIEATLERTFRVLPNDLDINGHMNNGRYLTVLDLMLVEYFTRIGFAAVLIKHGWRPISGGTFITYRRALKPFQTYRIRYSFVASEKHWNFMRYEFVDRDGRICAAGYIKGAAVSRTGLVENEVAYAKLGKTFVPGQLPDAIQHWLAAEKAVMAG